jgi:hypothetical protein
VTLKPTETGYQGRLELTWNDEQMTEMRNLLDDIKDAPMSKQGYPVTEQFMTDIHRDTIRLHDGPPKTDKELHYEESNRVLNKNLEELGLSDESPELDNKGPPKLMKDTAVEKMMTYTGSTEEDSNVCQNLSRFLQQDIWSSMMTRAYLVENESGERLLPFIDQASIERSYDVYKDGENYVIDMRWHSGISALTNNSTLTRRESETGHTLDMSMRLTIPRDNLKGDPTKPLTSYEILKGPTAALNLNYSENDVVE